MPNSLNARGYMPLNANYGFIFVGGENSSVHDEIYQNTIAHELGHGIFKLYHPWDTYGTSERQTNNLMDYQMGATLWKPQWDWIHDPGIRTYMFQKESEGAMKNIEIFAVQKLLDFIKANKGNQGVAFETKDYYSNIFDLYNYIKIYVPVKLGNSMEIKVFIDFKVANGTLDLSRNTNNLYNHIGLSIDLADEYHTGFYINFKTGDNSKLIELWTKTYDEYKAMLDYLGFKISDEPGIDYFVNQYKKTIEEAKSDCDKLDVIFETIPPIVLPKLGDEGNWVSLSSLLNCPKGTWGTNEYQAIANILNGFTPEYLYNKVKENKKKFREILANVPDNSISEYLLAFSKVGSSVWTDDVLTNSGETYAYIFESHDIPEEGISYDFSKEKLWKCGSFERATAEEVSIFSLGHAYKISDKSYPYLVTNADAYHSISQYAFFDPVLVNINEDYSVYVPSFVAYDVLYRFRDKPIQELLSTATSVLLPELSLVKFRNLVRIFKIRSSNIVAGGWMILLMG